jgi:hypothetical protein
MDETVFSTVRQREGSMKLFPALLLLLASSALAVPQIVRSFDAPDTGITGLACTASELYAVTGPSHKLFEIDPVSGATISTTTLAVANPNGLGMAGGALYLTNGTSTVYKYSTSGALQDSYGVFCSS